MNFAELSTYFERLEKTTSRNTITEILAELFKKSTPDAIGKICYLLQGRVVPLFEPIEFGVADKMMMRAIALGLSIEVKTVNDVFKKLGDIGSAAEFLKKAGKKSHLAQQTFLDVGNTIKNEKLPITDVFDHFVKIAKSTGPGSQDEKIKLLAELIRVAEPLSVRYLVRIPLGKMRLGFSDMTILDALSWMLKGDKSYKKKIEAAYNVRPDLGFIAQTVKARGMDGLRHVTPKVGTPIMMARANRLTSAVEIFEKIGKCAVEYKYDGLRLQVHYVKSEKRKAKSEKIKMFSRNLEDVTPMFPDIAEAVKLQTEADEVIFEGEVVAYNPKTHVFVPFQETMQRKRKYDIAAKALEIPVKLFVFELLYVDGISYLTKTYEERKKKLKLIIKTFKDSRFPPKADRRGNDTTGSTIVYAQEKVTQNETDVEDMFAESVSLHFEGIIAKKLDGVYEAGIRGWNWIKFKKAMSKKLNDTLDVLVMGYTLGEGKRTAFGVGQFLTGVYDQKQDKFMTVTKIGTGLTDEQFREFIKRVHKLKSKEKPATYEVDTLLTPDVWLMPGLVVEVSSDEITRSAVHTAGRVMEKSKSGKAFSVKTPGFALRFPRLEKFRDDKRPEDATTVTEIDSLFKKQGQ